jgi:Domain of unknown function (DUF4173)
MERPGSVLSLEEKKMTEKTKRGLKVLEAALLLGILGDGLLRATPSGLNILLWTGALVIALVVLLGRRRRVALAGGGHWLLISALLFAAAFAWRDSETLNLLAGSGLLVTLALMAWRARMGRIWLAGLTEYALGILTAGVNSFVAGFPLLLKDVKWKEIPGAGWSRQVKAILRGVLIAVPLVILFGGLFIAADAGFERLVNRIFFLDFETVFGHVLLAFALAWIAGGFLRGLLFGREVKIRDGRAEFVALNQTSVPLTEAANISSLPELQKPGPLSLGMVEIGITLGLLNLLFLAFVALQLRYFFGGAGFVQVSGGPTFSEYYRRGFFELVTVAALVLPILLVAHWLLRKENPKHERIFRLLAGTQVALLFVIMTSAVRRMLLYQSEYGLTELRLYTTAFMFWLALVFVWFVATALRGRRDQFACGALVAGLLVIAALHVINPDAFIVRVNVRHAQAGRGFDAGYATSLSADAVPALIENLPFLSGADQRIIARRITNRWSQPASGDWRSWNWSRARASGIVMERAEELSPLSLPEVVEVTDAPQEVLSPVSEKSVSLANPPTSEQQSFKQVRKVRKH